MKNIIDYTIPVAVDISDYSVEIMQINKNKEVLSYSRVILDQGIVEDGDILDEERLILKIKEALKKAKPQAIESEANIKCIASLPESKTFVRLFRIGKGYSKEELKQSVKDEASQTIPLRSEDVSWSYAVSQSPEENTVNVLYAEALNVYVKAYKNVLTRSGLEPTIIDIESASLGRALIDSEKSAKSSSMIIDIGARTTNISIFKDSGILSMSVNMSQAGEDFTSSIMDKLKIGREEAEKIKNTHGFKSTEANKKTLSVLQEAVSRILSETKSAIEYYEENFGENINEIILTGGSSLIPKIDEYFSANIEKEVYVGDPIVKIKSEGVFKKTESSVLFSNVIGLSLRAISDKSDGINLLNNLDDRASRRGEKIRKFMTRPRKKEEKKSNKNPVFLGKNVIIVVLFVASVILLGFVVSRYIFIGNSSGNNEKSDILPTEEEFNTSDDSGRIEEDVTTVIPAIEYVIIQDTPTGWLNVRNGPGTSFSKISRVNPGEKYEFTDESNNWFKIVIPEDTENDADEIIGWISSEYAKIQ